MGGPPGLVEREARVFWRAGDYPFRDAPNYTMTPEDNRRAAEQFRPVPLVLTHKGTPLDGKLGHVAAVFPATADFSALGCKLKVPEWLDREYRDANGEPLPLRLSANWSRSTKTLKNVAIVDDPRIEDAAAFSLERRLAEACFAAGDMTEDEMRAMGAEAAPPPEAAPAPAAGPDPSLEGTLTVEGPPEDLRVVQAMAERMGLAVEMGGAEMPPEGDPGDLDDPVLNEAPMSATTAPDRGTGRGPSPREEALLKRLESLEARLDEAAFDSQSKALERDAAAFAQEMFRTGRILPYQREAVALEYLQTARDDMKYPDEVYFSKDGKRYKGTRLHQLRARYEAIPGNGLAAEAVPQGDAPFSELRSAPGGLRADPARVEALKRHTLLGVKPRGKNGEVK